ncbi:MAG: YhjD/YihY/BrkB family envelope integrity protein [Nitrospira sp.]
MSGWGRPDRPAFYHRETRHRLYLDKSDVGSAYGAAGSLVILLVWVYSSAKILLFGAEFTQVYANKVGSRIVPTDNAIVAEPAKANALLLIPYPMLVLCRIQARPIALPVSQSLAVPGE